MSNLTANLQRRDFLLATGAMALGASTGASAAQGEHEHHSSAYTALAAEAQHCVTTGNECLSHCIADMRAGSLELTECLVRVEELVAACEAMAKLAALGSDHVPSMAAVTKQVCVTCEEECRKYADKHEECKQCADSCVACIRECDKVIESA